MSDKLDELFALQAALMNAYSMHTSDKIPAWPVDFSSRSDQRFCSDIISRTQDELFEAKHHLKNAKKHRNKNESFDIDEYHEEIIDALHYFIELMILSGISSDKVLELYKCKHAKNLLRIEEEYMTKCK